MCRKFCGQWITPKDVAAGTLVSKWHCMSRQAAIITPKCEDTISPDVILTLNEMYRQKCVQYSGEDYTRCDEDGNVFKRVVIFMIQGLKKSVSVV